MVSQNIHVHGFSCVSLAYGLDHVDERTANVIVAIAVNDGIHSAVDKRQDSHKPMGPGWKPYWGDKRVDEHRNENGHPRQLEIHKHDGDGDELSSPTDAILSAREVSSGEHVERSGSSGLFPCVVLVAVVTADAGLALEVFRAEARRRHRTMQPYVTPRFGEDTPVQGARSPQRNDESGPDDDEHVVRRISLPTSTRTVAGSPPERWQHA